MCVCEGGGRNSQKVKVAKVPGSRYPSPFPFCPFRRGLCYIAHSTIRRDFVCVVLCVSRMFCVSCRITDRVKQKVD